MAPRLFPSAGGVSARLRADRVVTAADYYDRIANANIPSITNHPTLFLQKVPSLPVGGGIGTLSWNGWRNWPTAMSLAGIQNHPVTFLTKSATPPEGGE